MHSFVCDIDNIINENKLIRLFQNLIGNKTFNYNTKTRNNRITQNPENIPNSNI